MLLSFEEEGGPGRKVPAQAQGSAVAFTPLCFFSSLFVFCRVSVTFVNYTGDRTTLPGKVGESLTDVARRYNYSFLDGGYKRKRGPGPELSWGS